MELNKQLRILDDENGICPREEKIKETIANCQTVYFCQEPPMTYWDFLWTQFCYTRKRWWVMQVSLLLAAWQVILCLEDDLYRVRSMGIVGCLFVVLMIPELWRNRESDSIQVEASCLYSLRQVYAARITLFGMVDVVLLTVFSLGLGWMEFTLVEVLAQFLLPVTVTACICFSLLCGRKNCSEAVSLTSCLTWGGVWWLLLMNEEVYLKIAPPVWIALFVMGLVFLALAVRRTVRTTNQYWEVAFV